METHVLQTQNTAVLRNRELAFSLSLGQNSRISLRFLRDCCFLQFKISVSLNPRQRGYTVLALNVLAVRRKDISHINQLICSLCR